MNNKEYHAVEILLVEDNPGDVLLIREVGTPRFTTPSMSHMKEK